jgi:hypothetical protein
MDDLVLGSEMLAYLADIATSWLAYGIGFGAILWMIGQGMRLIFSFVRY